MKRKRYQENPPALVTHGKYKGELAGMLCNTEPDYCDKAIFAVIENRLLEVKDLIDHAVEKLREKPFAAPNQGFADFLVCIDAEINRVKDTASFLLEDDSQEATEIPPTDLHEANNGEDHQ